MHYFSVPGITKSQNELDGKHWTVKHKERNYWYDAVGSVVPACRFHPTKARVHFIRVSKRLIDPLNVYAGLKWMLDSLVHRGWLAGDSYKDVIVTADQRKCKGNEEPHMEIEIEYC